MASETKYRPLFSIAELQTAVDFLTRHLNEDEAKMLYAKLSVFLLKAKVGAVKPSHTKEIKRTMLEQIEGTEHKIDYAAARKELYDRSVSNPGLILSASELEMIQTYRWEMGLMKEEERAEYENKMFSI